MSAPGIIDATSTYAFTDIKEKISMKPKDPAAVAGMPLEFTLSAPSAAYVTEGKGVRMAAVQELLAFFVARPSKDLIIADQAALKDMLKAAVPFFESVKTSGKSENVVVSSAFGQVSMASFDFAASLGGAVKNGNFQESFGVTGLVLPQGILPAWTAELMPQNFKLDFGATDFDLETTLNLILANLDLAKDPPLPADMQMQLLQAVIPSGNVTLAINPSEISSTLYKLALDGSLKAGPASMPTGKATIRLTGIDQIQQKLQSAAATDSTAQSILGPMMMAKGFGKVEADGSVSWVVESGPTPGSILVNGLDVTKLSGAP
jgi:hypothetical protein